MEQEHAAPSSINTVAGLAHVALARDDLERAGVLSGAIQAHGEHRLGVHAARLSKELSEETGPAFLAAVARGRELELSDAAAIALADNPRY